MSLTPRHFRRLALLAWPAFIAALVMSGFATNANRCPLQTEAGYVCDAAWETSREILALLKPNAALAWDAGKSEDVGGAADRVVGQAQSEHRSHTVLLDAPKTSPPC